MFCCICVQQNAKLNLRAARNKELVFISDEFLNWKKALTRFKKHQLSDCHKLAIDYQMNFPTSCKNVLEMSNDAAKQTMESNLICLIKVIECLQYLDRQGLAMQGDTDDESNFIQLLIIIIIECQSQMNTLDFFFGLNLGQRLFSRTDNLSKTLQQTRMSAISGKRVTHLTKEVLQKMSSDASFKSFYDAILLKSRNYFSMTGPVLPRRTCAPKED